jgi:hypothetical protein
MISATLRFQISKKQNKAKTWFYSHLVMLPIGSPEEGRDSPHQTVQEREKMFYNALLCPYSF